jgi:hypothetical protein
MVHKVLLSLSDERLGGYEERGEGRRMGEEERIKGGSERAVVNVRRAW